MPREWDDHYKDGFLPWDTGEPDPLLVGLVDDGTLTPGKTFEVGCGTGTNVRYLAEKGFDVLGVDLAPTAIEQAKAKLAGVAGARVEVMDFLQAPLPDSGFEFVYDRGCFHVFDDASDQSRFAERVAEALAPGGHWVSLLGSTEGPPREMGPPRRSLRDVANAVEPHLEIVKLEATAFWGDTEREERAWLMVARRRLIPAQPSTRFQE